MSKSDKTGFGSAALREEHRQRWREEITALVEGAGGTILPTIAIATVRAEAPEGLLATLAAEGFNARASAGVLEIDIQSTRRGAPNNIEINE